jgi:hypothetical protein
VGSTISSHVHVPPAAPGCACHCQQGPPAAQPQQALTGSGQAPQHAPAPVYNKQNTEVRTSCECGVQMAVWTIAAAAQQGSRRNQWVPTGSGQALQHAPAPVYGLAHEKQGEKRQCVSRNPGTTAQGSSKSQVTTVSRRLPCEVGQQLHNQVNRATKVMLSCHCQQGPPAAQTQQALTGSGQAPQYDPMPVCTSIT